MFAPLILPTVSCVPLTRNLSPADPFRKQVSHCGPLPGIRNAASRMGPASLWDCFRYDGAASRQFKIIVTDQSLWNHLEAMIPVTLFFLLSYKEPNTTGHGHQFQR